MRGHVLDSSSLDAILTDKIAASWVLVTARAASTPLYVPALVLTEVRTLRPHLLAETYELLDHPSILRGSLTPEDAGRVAELLGEVRSSDVCAGAVVLSAQDRGWPVITGDPDRLRRVDPTVELVLL